MVLLFGQLAAMCSKLKHLKHLGLEVLVGDLGVEGERVFLETFWLEVGSFEKMEGEICVEILVASFLEEWEMVSFEKVEGAIFEKISFVSLQEDL